MDSTTFLVVAPVSVAKAAVLLASAEDSTNRGALAAAAVESYYSLFHLGQAFIWLLPDRLTPDQQRALFKTLKSGEELPDQQTEHKVVWDLITTRFKPPKQALHSTCTKPRALCVILEAMGHL